MTPYLNNCGFHAEHSFHQNLYAPGDHAAAVGLAAYGYEYVPSSCAARARCKLVLAPHGCKQDTATAVGDAFLDDSDLNQYADTNDLVILYPQVSAASPQGCWDWWGYLANDASYAQKSGAQMSAVMAMISACGG